MMHDLDRISEIFADTPLGGCALMPIPLAGSNHDRIEISLAGLDIELFDAWKIARAKLGEIGRWPIAHDANL